MTIRQLIVCSKSTWAPTLRREHQFAQAAAAHGIDVVFLERPEDVRALGSRNASRFLRSILGNGCQSQVMAGLEVRATGVIAPGHRGFLAARAAGVMMARSLRPYDSSGTVVVSSTPWGWAGLQHLRRARRVVDLADDWTRLIPKRAQLLSAWHDRVGKQADALVIASPELQGLCGPRKATLVRNGTDDALLAPVAVPIPDRRRLVYAGTLSERLDLDLLAKVLDLLPDWRLDLVGQCAFAQSGDQPSPRLADFLTRFATRVNQIGPVDRPTLAGVLDSADVLVAPNLSETSRGQDSMKMYDYLARGRSVVATPGVVLGELPGVRVASGPLDFAAAVRAGAEDSADVHRAQRDWASNNSFEARWPSWWAAVSGDAA